MALNRDVRVQCASPAHRPALCSEVCPGEAGMFSRRQSCRGRSQSPVVRIAEEMETEPSKPIDKIFRGEITSQRAVSKENALWPRKKEHLEPSLPTKGEV